MTHVHGEATPTTEKVKTARGPLTELKISSARNNPRFLFVVSNDVAVFLAAFAKKTQRLPRTDIARADDRYLNMKGGCS